MKNKQLVVLGMHRSGTSLFANWLVKSGLNMGSDLLGVGTGNKYGHFEDKDFLNLHEDIIRRNKLNSLSIEQQESMIIERSDIEMFKELIENKNNANSMWGWKDPRTALFIANYYNFLSNPFFVILFRKYINVIDSLIRRDIEILTKGMVFKNRLSKYIKLHNLKRQQILSKGNQYTKTYIAYNKKIIQFISQVPKGAILLIEDRQLPYEYEKIKNIINRNGFELDWIDFDMLFKKESLNTKSLYYYKKYISTENRQLASDCYNKLALIKENNEHNI